MLLLRFVPYLLLAVCAGCSAGAHGTSSEALSEALSDALFVTLGDVYGYTNGSQDLIMIAGCPVYGCYAQDVSDDGRTVVGDSHNGHCRSDAFAWTAEGGMRGLREGLGASGREKIPYGYCKATNVSADGTKAVGRCSGYFGPGKVFLWDLSTERGGFSFITEEDGFIGGISADGKVVVGTMEEQGKRYAFRWTEEQGLQPLPLLDPPQNAAPPHFSSLIVPAFSPGTAARKYLQRKPTFLSEATAVSADGLSIAGRMGFADGRIKSVVWRPNDDIHVLDTPETAGLEFMPKEFSGDAETIIGIVTNNKYGHKNAPSYYIAGFSWHIETSQVQIESLDVYRMMVHDISHDKEIVVGKYYTPTSSEDFKEGVREKAIIKQSGGRFVFLSDVLKDSFNVQATDLRRPRWKNVDEKMKQVVAWFQKEHGGDPAIVKLIEANAVSADGRYIVGTAMDGFHIRHAFRVYLPRTPAK
jgi:hypothetical protein